MAEQNPVVNNEPNNPISTTGSILSQQSRNSLLNPSQVITLIRSELSIIQAKQQQIDKQNAEIVAQQQTAFQGFNSSISLIRQEITSLKTNLNTVSLLLQQDAVEDRQRIQRDQEQERLLAERKIRIGKESQVERNIQAAVLNPAQKLAPKVTNLFSNVQKVLLFLLGGWITSQLVSSIFSGGKNISELFDNIKDNVLDKLKIFTGGLSAIGKGFSSIKAIIGNITKNIQNVLSGKTFNDFLKLIPGLSGLLGIKPDDKSGGQKPDQSGSPPPDSQPTGSGRFISYLSNLAQSGISNINDTLSSLMAASKDKNPLDAINKVTGSTFNAAEISEAMNKNTFGDPDKDAKIDELAKRLAEQASSAYQPAPQSDQTQPSTQTTPQTPQQQVPPLTLDEISKLERAWDNRNNPIAKGFILNEWNKLSPAKQIQVKQWADSTGRSWAELGLPDPTKVQGTPPAAPTGEAQMPPAQVTPPAEVTPPPRNPQQVEQSPQTTPNVTVIPLPGTGPSTPNSPPLTNGPLTDVPLISSSNPDNFYVLYSQLSYNVVI